MSEFIEKNIAEIMAAVKNSLDTIKSVDDCDIELSFNVNDKKKLKIRIDIYNEDD